MKTVTMTFRKGGRAAANVIMYGTEPLTRVPHFKYLGITMQTQGNVYTLNIKERAPEAVINNERNKQSTQDIPVDGNEALRTKNHSHNNIWNRYKMGTPKEKPSSRHRGSKRHFLRKHYQIAYLLTGF
ncbi:hypothetical protein ANN_27494 [Periplaneta americana]|uniref:Uncharacterized protein n=1 Tax=Periplaneta americana TaxID=6978 RepID=A0ABQ8RW36_PERAM|nr:hypothetical protein ANN_27494 [Periplaneta americana]